jgi:hypothetical protein
VESFNTKIRFVVPKQKELDKLVKIRCSFVYYENFNSLHAIVKVSEQMNLCFSVPISCCYTKDDAIMNMKLFDYNKIINGLVQVKLEHYKNNDYYLIVGGTNTLVNLFSIFCEIQLVKINDSWCKFNEAKKENLVNGYL